ncbi:MAG: DUF2336 domain-containing protein [Alphaproteobacteria bacterium]|nr:DUF2336 domain-containing protein [Alphaproteobacteria bacterium]
MSNLSYSNADTAFASVKVGGINPVLAKLYLSHGIRAEAISTMSSEDRTDLCDDVASLIEMAERPTDREMAADILLSLLRHAEKNLKEAISERLSVFDKAPLRLILQFINEDIDIAKPVLRKSPVLNDLDLLYIIQSRDSPFWQAIAQRQNLGENVIETLVDTKDIITAKNLVENNDVIFSDYALGRIVRLASETDILNACLIDRAQSLKGDFARRIYAYAGESLKTVLIEKCGDLSQDVSQTLEDVLAEFTVTPPPHFMPTASMLKAAELFMKEGKINRTLMLNTLKRGQIGSFIAQFSKFTQLPVSVVVAMLQQKSGRSLAIASKASGIDRNDFLVIFNFTRKTMGEDYLSSSDVATALRDYDRITPDVLQENN